ncbi:hypothetical protein PLICRDRAFT_171236 [Plicaturopsis crispa FD-325 SS-3]|nr:hypothetical protein PLICRDRAFT_171236 [Plicaturopsis crispa FD-325 SS-3]
MSPAQVQLTTVLRIHRRHAANTDTSRSLSTLLHAANQAAAFSETVIIVLDGGDAALTKAITSDSQLNRFELLPVQPWGFSGPLNAAVVRASALGATHVAFVSVEVTIEPEQIQQMLSLFTPRTLVVGQAMKQHTFAGEGTHDLTGLTAPWNTCAIWNLPQLARTGFPCVADTNTPPGNSAIEEVPAIALHQLLFPETSQAILVKVHATKDNWHTEWEDPGRLKWQASKLATKDKSAASHLRTLGLQTLPRPAHSNGHANGLAKVAPSATVIHVDLSGSA